MNPVSIVELLIKGIPESFLLMLALYIFTDTKVSLKKYILLSAILTIITYITRWFPINLGTHTMLTLLALIFIHLAANRINLNYIIKTIISVIVIALIILISETLDYMLLSGIYGEKHANELINSSNNVIKSVSAIPSILILAIVILVVYIVKKRIKHKGLKDGKSGEETGA